MNITQSEINQQLLNHLQQIHHFNIQQEWSRFISQDISLSQHQITQIINQTKSNQTTKIKINKLEDLKILINYIQSKPYKKIQKQNIMWNIIKTTLNQKMVYKKIIVKFKQILQQTVITIQNKLSSMYKDFSYYSDIEQENDLKQAYNMCKFIQNSIKKIEKQSQLFKNFDNTLTLLKVKNSILAKDNEALLNHIQERKVYSEKLKLKINQLKQKLKESQDTVEKTKIQLKQSVQFNQQKQKIIQELKIGNKKNNKTKIMEDWNLPQGDFDIKYINRNDLIHIIKALTYKIHQHQKQYDHQENEVLGQPLGKFLNNSVPRKRNTNQSAII